MDELERIKKEIARAIESETDLLYYYNGGENTYSEGRLSGLIEAALIIGLTTQEIDEIVEAAKERAIEERAMKEEQW